VCCNISNEQLQGLGVLYSYCAAVVPKAADGTLKQPVQLIICNKMRVINVNYDVCVYIASQL
jgi:hypothetical protein